MLLAAAEQEGIQAQEHEEDYDWALRKEDMFLIRSMLEETGAEVIYIEECNQWQSRTESYEYVKAALLAGCRSIEELRRTQAGLRDSGALYAHTGCAMQGNVIRYGKKLYAFPYDEESILRWA